MIGAAVVIKEASIRSLVGLMVAIGVYLVFVPLVNVGIQVWPWRVTGQDWRFGAWGFFLGAMTLPTLGAGLIALGGALGGRIGVARVAVLVAVVLALATVAGLFDFMVSGNALKMAGTDGQTLRLYDQEIRRTVFISILAVPALLAIALGSFRALKEVKSGISSFGAVVQQ